MAPVDVVADAGPLADQTAAPDAAIGPNDPAKPTVRQLPPEKDADIRRRSWVVLSFWLVVLCLGVPIWWRTTEIYRATLPIDEMLSWSEGKACRPVFPLQISLQAPFLSVDEAFALSDEFQSTLDDLNEYSGHHLRLQVVSTAEGPTVPRFSTDANDIALTIRLTPSKDGLSAHLDPHTPLLDITYPSDAPPVDRWRSRPVAAFVADEVRSIFSEEQTIIASLLSSTREARLPDKDAAALVDRITRSLRYAPTYHLTFSLFTAGATPNSWDIDSAISQYVRPVLDLLSPIHNFTIDTQVQLYATPGAQADVLTTDDLSSFINAAEWPLSPSIGGDLTTNFVIFVGDQTIGLGESGTEGTSQSWLIPQWGAVYILPPPDQAPTTLSSEHLKQPMLTFTGHLLTLLGAPQTTTLPLRLSTLSRIRSADVLLRASSTLGALARLVTALRSISVPSSVADGVTKSLAHLQLACQTLGGPDGLRHGRIAEHEAERAFFEKSMVGQLYFPEEHKIAVYLPLLGPVGVPLVIGLINELKGWQQRRRQRTHVH
jgi:phosphatidylinositol glycan class S